jgi:hypothetical protein
MQLSGIDGIAQNANIHKDPWSSRDTFAQEASVQWLSQLTRFWHVT